ncbi:type I pullulanase [Streptococcus hongkongensis]
MRNTVIIHYHSQSGRYFDLSLWQWQDGKLGQDAYFSRYDSFGAVAVLDYQAPYFLSHAYVIVKDQFWKHKTIDYRIEREYGLDKSEVWIVDGDSTLYYSRQAAVSSHHYRIRNAHSYDMAINSSRFDKKWGFSGWLGYRYLENQTSFRLWAPTAERVDLVLYDSTDENASVHRVYHMARGKCVNPDNHFLNRHGVWEVTLYGDHNYQSYVYRVHYRKRTFVESRDPYSIATTANGRRSIVINPEHLVPEGFSVKQNQEATWRLDNPNQAVIYEMHVRDFSTSETSGVTPQNRGKFRGLFERGTKNIHGDATCFDYVTNLGITHIQLQPIFDHHQSLNDDGNYAYNWGYDPENFNVPEASFASNPHEPASRILELKEAIQAYHDAGINVVIDVVFNHTYSSRDSAFQLTVPDYYYRMNPNGTFQNGSGCGNETASEKEMYRKYMIDSILYWIHEYNVDGFRFDLMGLHDVETMNQIRQVVDKIDPRIILYGEGWDMGTGLASHEKAKKENAHLMPGIGFFNDTQRNAVKGAEVYGAFVEGFVSGAATEDILAKAFLGSDELNSYLSPNQVINYVEAHDNYNLNDLFLELNANDSSIIHTKRVQLATAMNLVMQGVSFMQLGQEFLRTKLVATGPKNELTQEDKHRAMNSYNASDDVNQVNWNLITFEKDTINFVKKLILLKTKSDLFSFSSYDEIRRHVYIESATKGSGFISFTIKNSKKYQFIFSIYGKRLQEMKYSDIIISNDKRFQNNDLIINNLTAMILDITEKPD